VTLVGREAELSRLSGWVNDLAAGQGRAALLDGEPGIGKTALLHATAQAAAAAGCAVYRGAGEELTQAFPLLPLLRAFAVRPSSPDPLRAEAVRALPGGGGAEAVSAAVEALIDLVDQLCAQSPALLVVDDLHWADAATAAVCHRLVRTTDQRPLLLLAAMRPLPHRDDLRALRRHIGRDGQIRLAPLLPNAATRLVAELAGGTPGPRLARLTESAAGNPLYLTELVDALARAGTLAPADTGATVDATEQDAPASLAEAIGDRLDFLPAPVREVLQAAALLGAEFDVADLAIVTGRRVADLAPAIADARAAGVLAEAETRLAFRHPLIHTALYHQLPPPTRAARHHNAAHALRQAGMAPTRVAGQLLPALDNANTGQDNHPEQRLEDWVVDWLVQAGPELTGAASEVAVRLLRATIPHLSPADPRRHALASRLALALGYQNENAAVEELATQTLPHVTDPDILIALLDALARARSAQYERLPETLAAIDQALAAFPGLTPRARNRLGALAARVHYQSNDLDTAERTARTVLAKALATFDDWTVSSSANTLAAVRSDRGDNVGALAHFGQGIAATDGQPALIDHRLMLLGNRGQTLIQLDRLEEAHVALTEMRILAERTGKLRRLVSAQSYLCELSYSAGRWDDALAEAGPPDRDEDALSGAIMHAVAALVLLHRQQTTPGRWHLRAARKHARRLRFPLGLWARAEALDREIAGDPAGALAVYRTALGNAKRLVETETWLAHIVRLATGQGDHETAAEAARRADDLRAMRATPGRVAAVAHCRGLVDHAPAALLEAADGFAEASRPLPRAQALESAALLLAERGDTAKARHPLTAAIDIYTDLGADWDLAQTARRFQPHGLRPPTRHRRRPAAGWEALTAAEAKVAELVAAGRSNPEIAAELFISRSTVKTHVERVLAKLHARSRTDIARAAAKHAQPRQG
jgi:DNA-binding CsgD family transcriptional regulator